METTAKTEPASDLDILAPDCTVHIGGEEVTVKEFTFLTGLRAEAVARPIIKELAQRYLSADNQEPPLDDLAETFGRNADAFLELLTISTGKERAWLEGLTDMEGRLLMLTFWTVNSAFFMSRLVLGAIASLAAQRKERPEPSDGEKS